VFDGAGRQDARVRDGLGLAAQRETVPVDQHQGAVAGDRAQIVDGRVEVVALAGRRAELQ
jgi:hypothetical protein